MGKSDNKAEKSAASELQAAEEKKIRPFNVMDQMVAHRLAMEGFEILNVIPSNKYAKEAHFIFAFNSNAAFRKRFKEILEEVEREGGKPSETEIAAELTAEIERLRAENAELRSKKCVENDEESEKNAPNSTKTGQNCTDFGEKDAHFEKNPQNQQITAEIFENGVREIMDKLASLEALGNCTLSNVSAIGFFERLHKKSDKEG